MFQHTEVGADPIQPVSSSGERRSTRQILSHWELSRRQGKTPLLRDLDLSADHDFRQRFILVRTDQRLEKSIIVLCGEAVQAACRVDLLGKTLLQALPTAVGRKLCRAWSDARRQTAPVEIDGRFETCPGVGILYRSVFLPVRGDNDPDCGYACGTFGWRFEQARDFAA